MDISIFDRTAHAVSSAVVRLTLAIIFLAMVSRVAAAASVWFIGTNIGGGGNGIAVADVNRDGKLDIIETNGGVTVFLGNGDGTFQAARQFTRWWRIPESRGYGCLIESATVLPPPVRGEA